MSATFKFPRTSCVAGYLMMQNNLLNFLSVGTAVLSS